MPKGFYLLLCLALVLSLLTGCAADSIQAGPNGKVPGTPGQDGDQNSGFDKNKISREVISGNTRFAFDIFRELDKGDAKQNIFISPLSISTALAMTYQGAAGSTKEAMAKTLGYSGIDEGQLNDSYQNLIPFFNSLDDKVDLNISNSVWVREGEEIKPEFLAANRDIFQASVIPLNFDQDSAADKINQWIFDATYKKIDKMVDSPISPDVIMYLINAIYFKGDWAEQFDSKNTFKTYFKAEDGRMAEAMMMSRTGKAEYFQGEDYQAIRLPYASGKAAMYCMLPREDIPINEFIAGMDAERWQEIRDSLAERDEVLLQLPRFQLEYGIKNLNASLAALGMGEAFTEKADFSGIRNDVCISRVLHKAIIEVNEEGSEAAAATAVEMKLTAAAEPLAFIADRPFLFLIADDETGTILFLGKLRCL